MDVKNSEVHHHCFVEARECQPIKNSLLHEERDYDRGMNMFFILKVYKTIKVITEIEEDKIYLEIRIIFCECWNFCFEKVFPLRVFFCR